MDVAEDAGRRFGVPASAGRASTIPKRADASGARTAKAGLQTLPQFPRANRRRERREDGRAIDFPT